MSGVAIAFGTTEELPVAAGVTVPVALSNGALRDWRNREGACRSKGGGIVGRNGFCLAGACPIERGGGGDCACGEGVDTTGYRLVGTTARKEGQQYEYRFACYIKVFSHIAYTLIIIRWYKRS